MNNKNFWKNKKVLITGHTGFKGSWLSIWLNNLGADVTSLALSPPTNPSLFDVANVANLIHDIRGDIRDRILVDKTIHDSKPEIIFHLAAQPIVRKSYKDPVTTFETNILGTVNVLDAIKNSVSVRAAVIITTDKVYENREWIWGYRENEPLGGYDPYSSSKACAELIVSSYCRSFFNPDSQASHPAAIASARAGNVIGGGDWAEDRLVPDTMNAFMNNTKAVIRNPNAIRPWQHVLEPLGGYLLLAQNLFDFGHSFSGAWNFGPHEEDAIPVGDVIQRLSILWGEHASYSLTKEDGPHEAHFLTLDWTKAKKELGWTPTWSVDTALNKTVDWYKAFRAGCSMQEFTSQQIFQFQNCAILKNKELS